MRRARKEAEVTISGSRNGEQRGCRFVRWDGKNERDIESSREGKCGEGLREEKSDRG